MKKIVKISTLMAVGMSNPIMASDLIAYWSFDNFADGYSVDDRAGNTGVFFNGAQYTNEGTGKSGAGSDRGLLLGNGLHRMEVIDPTFLNAIDSDEITISYWQNLSSVSNAFIFWADAVDQPRAMSLAAPFGDSTVYWDINSNFTEGEGRTSTIPGNATWLSTWEHVVVTKKGNTKRIYINGVEAINGASTETLASDYTKVTIGNNTGAANEPVQGTIDDFAIFSRELTDVEVTSLFNGDSPESLVGPNDTDNDGLADDWETRVAGDLTTLEAGGDPDGDGISNEDEFIGGTNPNKNDTDGDNALDGEETGTGIWVDSSDRGTNPLVADTDGDGISDGAETNTGTFVDAMDSGTDPHVPDTDLDGFSDGAEVIYASSNPTSIASIPLRPGQLDLLAYWDFNDATDPNTTSDSVKGFVGNLKPGTAISADATGRTSSAGDRALDMGPDGSVGTGVIVDQAGFLDLAAAQDQIAISFWVSVSSFQNSMAVYGVSPSLERAFSAHATWSDGNIYWDTAGCCNGGSQRTLVNGGFTENTWTHVVLNKNGDTKQIWVDGAMLIEGTNTGDLPLVFSRFYIGTDSATLNQIGLMDDVAVYADALTPEEIALLFGGTAPNDPALVPPSTDTDGDGMQDAYEDANGLDKNVDDRLGDVDSDNVDNITEFLNGTKPNDDDSDDDTLLDGVETNTGTWVSATDTGTDPLNSDSDGDSLGDAVETNTGTYVSSEDTGTNPNLGDTDGDRWSDADEIKWPTNASDADEFPTVDPEATTLLAFWDFNDNSNPDSSADVVRGFEAEFFGADAKFSADALGRTESAGDLAFDLGVAGGSNGAQVENARWFGLGVPLDRVIKNLGSSGAAGDMNVGSGVLGVDGALTGDNDTALSNTPPANGTRTFRDPALNPNGPWSAEVWLKPEVEMAAGSLTCAISSGDFAAPRKGWLIYQSDAGWNFRTYYNDGLSAAVNITGNNGAPPVAGEWTHLVATWDGTVGRLYVDGVLSVTSSAQPYVPGEAGAFAVGTRADGAFQWDGDIDEVAFYGTALSDADVAEHYENATSAAPGTSYDALVLSDSPIGYWRMTSDAPEPGNDRVAVSFWQKLDSVSNSSAFWASSSASGANVRGFQAHSSWGDGNYYFDTTGTGADTQRISGFADLQVDQWEHFVYQKNGPVKEVWRNGVLELSGDLATPLFNDFFRLTIGAEPTGVGVEGRNATRGLMDDFAVFAGFLEPDEIERLASGESALTISGPGTGLTITDVVVTDTLVTLTWNSRTGKTYLLEASTSMFGLWDEINDSIDSDGDSTTFSFPIDILGDSPAKNFFRVVEND